jgi:DNA-binding NtrC family response regulator
VETVASAERGSSQVGLPVPSVLVLDDHAGIRDMLKALLEDAGFRVCTAEHGARRWRASSRTRSRSFCWICRCL